VTTLIYETVHGSRAYGLAREGSDVDLKGVVVGPAAWYHGFVGGPEQVELSADHVRFEVRKAFRLLANANPTLLELLWTHPDDHRVVTPAGERLLAARDGFLSRRVADSFGGYALGQLKRLKGHRRWLLEPPQSPPTRVDFGLPDRPLVSRDQLGAAEALRDRGDAGPLQLDANFLAVLDAEKRYRSARADWKQYQGWLRDRNPSRAALEARFGYDTKHAMHLVRLQRMAGEILATGEVRVRRDDREELLAVRDGVWSYDELIERAEAASLKIGASRGHSSLPDDVDRDALDALCASIVQEVLR
jgi:uncharacterized protein